MQPGSLTILLPPTPQHKGFQSFGKEGPTRPSQGIHWFTLAGEGPTNNLVPENAALPELPLTGSQ